MAPKLKLGEERPKKQANMDGGRTNHYDLKTTNLPAQTAARLLPPFSSSARNAFHGEHALQEAAAGFVEGKVQESLPFPLAVAGHAPQGNTC